MGFPSRKNRDALGPTYENERPVRNSKRELGQNVVNLLMWDESGMSQVVPKVVITADVGIVEDASGSHTGADNQAVMTDSTKTFTVNALVGKTITNVTDGSSSTITSNTADTVTGVLSGGTDDDWDTSDTYTITSQGVTVDYQGLAWDGAQAQSDIDIGYIGPGNYTFQFASTYVDELGNAQSTALEAGIVVCAKGREYASTHDGANNQAVLTDSTQTWVVNELVGKRIYNITDGSTTAITANTATTVTGVLAGGSDDDWDTGDFYMIISQAQNGVLNVETGFSGQIFFFDTDYDFADPAAFLLVIW